MARVLHLIARDHRRGAETFAVELAEYLRSAGHDVRVLAVEASGTDAPLPVEVAGPSRWAPATIRRVIAAAGWSEVVVSFGSTSLLAGALAARARRRPFVYRNIGDPTVWGRVRLADLRVGAPVRSATRVVAVFPAAAEVLEARYRVDPERIAVIPRGVPAERFTPSTPSQRIEARAALGLDPDLRWVSYVGALSPEKDPLLAVEALSELPADVGLVVAGSGPLDAEVRSRGRSFGSRLRLLGNVADVRPVYAATEALILPSRTEGVPGSAVEAGLSGLAVAAFPVGGVPWVVEDRRSGRLVGERTAEALAAGLLEVLADSEAMGAAARQRCRELFAMDRVGAAWEAVIAELT